MAGSLPKHVRVEIGEYETIVYWTRRAVFEVVSEVGQSIFWIWVFGLFILDASEGMNWPDLRWMLLFCFPIAGYGTWEIIKWYHDIHLVTEFDHQSGGMYRPFWISKMLSYKGKDIPIDKASPDVSHDQPWYVRWWGNITGERMEKVTVTSQSRSYLEGNRVPLALRAAITAVRGSPSSKDLERDPTIVQLSRELRTMGSIGQMPQWRVNHLLAVLWDGVLEQNDQ